MDLFLSGPAGRIEARMWEPEGGRAARAACVFCHPYPPGGGTMNTTAVFRAARALQLAGLQVLRFNFRGVGQSEGVHDGHGGEELDLAAGLDYMQREFPKLELWAGGFSFGSRVSASRAAIDARIKRVILLALPVRAFDCSFITKVQQPGLILMAGEDEYGTLPELRAKFPDLQRGLELDEIPATNHYFEGQTQELQSRVQRYAERHLPPAP